MKKELSKMNLMEYEYENMHRVKKTRFSANKLFKELDKIDLDSIDEANDQSPQQKANDLRMKISQKNANVGAVNNELSNLAGRTPGTKEYERIMNGITDPSVKMQVVSNIRPQLERDGLGVKIDYHQTDPTQDFYRIMKKGDIPKTNNPPASTTPSASPTPPAGEKVSPPDAGTGATSVPVNAGFDEYLHMIKTSPNRALEHITRQKDLNEFVKYLETLTQDQIDEKVQNRQHYYTFKYYLASKLGVYNQLKDKENPWSKVYLK